MVHLDPLLVKLEGESHWSKFTVTGCKIWVSALVSIPNFGLSDQHKPSGLGQDRVKHLTEPCHVHLQPKRDIFHPVSDTAKS